MVLGKATMTIVVVVRVEELVMMAVRKSQGDIERQWNAKGKVIDGCNATQLPVRERGGGSNAGSLHTGVRRRNEQSPHTHSDYRWVQETGTRQECRR